MKTVVVGLSGGVDSSVAAHLLIKQGYNVIGLFMRNWNDESVIIENECPWITDSNDALEVAEMLGIPFQVLDFSKEYKERIVNYMFDEYKNGRTPNPDILCNREVKFDLFLKKALELGADYVATGHYCRKKTFIKDGVETHQLLAGIDISKDQSYFLCQVNQKQLKSVLFPLGELKKSEVRDIARKIDLNTAEKKDSQGLCFIGKVKLPVFLQQQLKPKNGDVIELSSESEIFSDVIESNFFDAYKLDQAEGKIIGNHNGAHYYTIGQRKGLQIGGTPKPLFIIGTDTKKNIIYVGQGENHKGLFRRGLKIKKDDMHWIREDLKMNINESRKYLCRIRYRQALTEALFTLKKNYIEVLFNEDQRGITPGQFIAWYENEEVIGSGIIN